MNVLLRPRKSGLNAWRDRSPDSRRATSGLSLPTLAGSGLSQTLRCVAHSCGAVAEFHRASRSSRQWLFLWRSLKLDSFLRRDACFKRMFQQRLRGQICDFQDFWFGVAPRQDDRGFSFAVASVDDNEALLPVGGRSCARNGLLHGVVSFFARKLDGWSALASPSRASNTDGLGSSIRSS